MSAKRHRHTFHGLWWNFGPYGRQDVHVHSCWDSTACGGPGCDRVVIGEGRDCKSDAPHWRATLT